MPLPQSNVQWPPASVEPVYSKMAEWAAWYSGEATRITDVYASTASSTGAVPWWRFWSRARSQADSGQRAQIHVPLASDLAAVSGSLLFGEPARVRVRAGRAQDVTEAPAPGDASGGGKAKRRSPEQRSEERLLDIIERGAVNSRLVEAAETAAAIGGVYIYPVWDKDLRDFPLMAIAQADQAVPEFRYGLLTAVTFSRVVDGPDGVTLRHLERHEVEGTGADRKAVVLHGLYKGTKQELGAATDLALSEDTSGLQPRIELPFAELDVEYVPNIRPNRLWRASGHGVADIQGSETLLDALDETYASWMRDVRLAKARIIVPREYLAVDPQSKQAGFDIDQEIYVGMDMDPGLTQDARAMLAHQFQIRYLEHKGTSEALIDRIVSNAGYSTSTLGAASVAGAAGTSLRIAEHKTILTLKRKSGWWEAAVANVLYRMMLIDREIFGGKAPAIRPVVHLADSIIDTPLELAQTALAMKTAEAASIETRVRLLNPDMSEVEVDAEVKRITDELEAAKPAPAVGGSGAFGNPKDDPAATSKKPTTAPGQAPANDPPTTPPQAPNAD